MRSAPNAVSYFGTNSAEFDALYGADPAFRQRYELFSKVLGRLELSSAVAIDAGCGSGVFSLLLAQRCARVVGFDAAAEMVARCEERRRELGVENASFFQARLPGVDRALLPQADLLLSSSVVEYLPELDETLALFAATLKPGGTLLLSMPNALSLSRVLARLRHRLTGRPEVYRFIKQFTTPGRLAKRLLPLGFALEQVHYFARATRVARVSQALRLPETFTDELFLVVARKQAP
jgi:2-polyprenyl-3-methyl-5-hydroxy-6-metoxy-1,4-benzoquinol methylase